METDATCPEASFLQQKEDIHIGLPSPKEKTSKIKVKRKPAFSQVYKAMSRETMEATLSLKREGLELMRDSAWASGSKMTQRTVAVNCH